MCIQIVAVGSNALIADEIECIVRRILGDGASVRPMVSAQVTGKESADLYVCAVTQEMPLREKMPAERLCVLDLRPTAQFFIDISHIPAGETVYIFNSNRQYAEMLREMCEEHKIHRLDFVTVAYEDMPEAAVIARLRTAKYIIGVGKLVEKEVLLSEKYRPFLRPDVTIIGRTRMATMQTACGLIERAQALSRKKAAQEIALLAEALQALPVSDAAYQEKSRRMERLIEKQKEAQPLKKQLLDSLAAQLSDALHGECDAHGEAASYTGEDSMAGILQGIGQIMEQGNRERPAKSSDG